ncbi:INO80 complex subunit E isoform X1 [Ambystoma mexicanum]|uniref:INO80 complex subunit E isoform X1 n=1 Tax=Ambystoma mexicanum TaxID=8296 RepID=UPI0037E87AA8
MNGQSDVDVDYKRKYRNLKRKLKFLIYEQECFQEELRKAQRKLLKVSRDKSFLLDRLLQYENVDEDSSDSDATASSDNSEGDGPKSSDLLTPKRKKSPQLGSSASPSSSLSMQMSAGFPLQSAGTPSSYLSSMTSPPYAQFPTEYLAPVPGMSSVKSEKARKERRPKAPKAKKPKVPLTSSSHSDMAVGGLPYHPRAGASLSTLSSQKLPPPTILSTVPQQMFSDTGEGSGDDPLDGDDDDDLVIDIPE